MTLKNAMILEIASESTRSYTVENPLWNRFLTCRKRDYIMNE
jgi:hypothetical protein